MLYPTNFCVAGLQNEHVLHMVKAKPQGVSARCGHNLRWTWLSIQAFLTGTVCMLLYTSAHTFAALNAVLVPVRLELQQLLPQAQQHLPLNLQTQET